MELATLLIIASIHRVRAGGIFVVDGNPNESAGDMADYNPHRDEVERAKEAAIEIALEALCALANS
jgi:uridine phosphorylase